MNAAFLKQIIERDCQDFDLVVLKGFSPKIVNELGSSFNLLDSYIIENNKIVLENINETRLMLSILGTSTSTRSICTCESFIKMCTHVAGLDILQKKIGVLDNNLVLPLFPLVG